MRNQGLVPVGEPNLTRVELSPGPSISIRSGILKRCASWMAEQACSATRVGGFGGDRVVSLAQAARHCKCCAWSHRLRVALRPLGPPSREHGPQLGRPARAAPGGVQVSVSRPLVGVVQPLPAAAANTTSRETVPKTSQLRCEQATPTSARKTKNNYGRAGVVREIRPRGIGLPPGRWEDALVAA